MEIRAIHLLCQLPPTASSIHLLQFQQSKRVDFFHPSPPMYFVFKSHIQGEVYISDCICESASMPLLHHKSCGSQSEVTHSPLSFVSFSRSRTFSLHVCWEIGEKQRERKSRWGGDPLKSASVSTCQNALLTPHMM